MEKDAGKSKRFRHGRLLTFFALLALCSFPVTVSAKVPSPAEIRALVIKSEHEICFTAQDSVFTLEIPGIEASKLQAELGTLPKGIQFQTSRRDVYFDDASLQSGTRLYLSFVFSETGSVTIPPLTVTIANRRYRVPFQTVTVYENLATLSPKLTIQFDDERLRSADKSGTLHIEAGTEIRFSVALSYCVQLVKFHWTLPKNALFREVSRSGIADGAFLGKDFSPDSHPVAIFSWTPLVEGLYALPDITVTAVAYNGMKKTIALPLMAVAVEAPAAQADISGKTAAGSEPVTALFSEAFMREQELPPQSAPEHYGTPDCAYLAALRSAERQSFPFSKSRRERIAYEKEFSLSAPAEARLRIAELFYALFALAAVLFLILCIQRHIKRAAVTASIAICILVACIHLTMLLSPHYAIFAGGELRTIPEQKATPSRTEPAGVRVRILENAGEWVYIATPQANGWVQETMIYEIR